MHYNCACIAGVLLFKERLTALKMFCVGLIIAGVVGINF